MHLVNWHRNSGGGTKPLTSVEKFNSIAIGILDGFSFGLYSENVLTDESLARLENDDAGYEAGNIASVGIGLGRVLYASAAKGISLFSSSAEAAVKNRNTLKGLMSGLGSAHPRIKTYDQMLAKYGSDQAVRAAAGRTDTPINAAGALGITVPGNYGASLLNTLIMPKKRNGPPSKPEEPPNPKKRRPKQRVN